MRRRRPPIDFRLDIAPVNLIDLLLVLLIFFVTTTSFLQLQVIDLTLPKTRDAQNIAPQKDTHSVNVDAACRVYLDKKAVEVSQLSTLLSQLKAQNAKNVFRIGADAASPHECFVKVLEQFQKAEIENIAILTKMAKGCTCDESASCR